MSGEYYHHHNSNQADKSAPLPLHLCFFVSILFLFLGLSWYLSYESAVESLFDQVKVGLMLLPVVFLLVLHCLSASEWFSFVLPFQQDRESAPRSGGSPWGVALVLVILILMVAYKSSFQDRWLPLISK